MSTTRTRIKNPSKILILDIERLPGLARVWEPKTRYIAPRSFVEWPRLLCWAARWYGEKDYVFASEWSGKSAMLSKIWDLYDECDICVTFNGINFDNRHLKSEWLEAGFRPPRPWKDVDLYKIVKQFGFESKSLDSVSRRLGRPGGKALSYDADTAFAAAGGNQRAQNRLRRYNQGDVELTEWLYDRLRGWIPTHPFIGDNDVLENRCNQCGSAKLKREPSKYRAVVLDYHLYRCGDCGGLVRGAWDSRVSATRGVA